MLRLLLYLLIALSSDTLLSIKLAYGYPSCAAVFASQNETFLHFTGRIFSPPDKLPGTKISSHFMDGSILHTTGDINNGRMRVWIGSERPNYKEDGFVPNFSNYIMQHEYEQLRYGFAIGLKTIHQGYGSRLSDSEIQSVIEADWAQFSNAIASNRVGYAYVKAQNISVREEKNSLDGFMRVYDGSDYTMIDGAVVSYGGRAATNATLPSEYLLNKKGIKTDIFNTYRKNGYQIFEIGKYFLSHELNSKDYQKTRLALFEWLMNNYLTPENNLSQKVIFVIDVSSPVHERAYRKLFGANKLDKSFFNPPLEAPDAIMVVDQKILRDRVQKLLEEH